MPDPIFLSAPDVGPLEEAAVLEAMRSGWIAPLGPHVDAFEEEVAARVGVAHGVALSSGTAALHLALLCAGVGSGDVVVTSTMTFAATANAIVYTGAEPFFVDVELATGNMDPALLRQALEELLADGRPVKAVVPVDLLGKAADYTAIMAVTEEYDLPVVADAAESLGARHRGRPAGSFGAASIVSFNGNKIMTTSGGGMLLTDDMEMARRVRYLATQARQPVAHYEHTEIGFNYRLSNLLAALGRAQLSRLDEMIARRRRIREMYARIFSDVRGVTVFGYANGEEDNAWLTSIQVDPAVTGWEAGRLSEALARLNIECRPIWKPMHLQPVFRDAQSLLAPSRNAEVLFERGVTLPSGSSLNEAQLGRILDGIDDFLADVS